MKFPELAINSGFQTRNHFFHNFISLLTHSLSLSFSRLLIPLTKPSHRLPISSHYRPHLQQSSTSPMTLPPSNFATTASNLVSSPKPRAFPFSNQKLNTALELSGYCGFYAKPPLCPYCPSMFLALSWLPSADQPSKMEPAVFSLLLTNTAKAKFIKNRCMQGHS